MSFLCVHHYIYLLERKSFSYKIASICIYIFRCFYPLFIFLEFYIFFFLFLSWFIISCFHVFHGVSLHTIISIQMFLFLFDLFPSHAFHMYKEQHKVFTWLGFFSSPFQIIFFPRTFIFLCVFVRYLYIFLTFVHLECFEYLYQFTVTTGYAHLMQLELIYRYV